jgi:undecaprenyl-diphosphatase
MTIGQAIALGTLQGLGEFLPISSSGHLIVVPWLLGWPLQSLAFDVALHLGTLLAVAYAFAGDWWRLGVAGLSGLARGRPFAEPAGRLLGLLVISTVPGALAGLLLDEWAESTFRSPALVACDMAALGLVLLFADRRASGGRQLPELTPAHALWIGLSQALAIVPGVSRSGATITTALLLGYRREEAARYSFLMALPITLGAALFKVPELFTHGASPAVLAGMAAAAFSGFAAIRGLLAYVRTRTYRPFAYYRFAFALVVLVVLLVRGATLR